MKIQIKINNNWYDAQFINILDNLAVYNDNGKTVEISLKKIKDIKIIK